MRTLVIATRNAHKMAEIRVILGASVSCGMESPRAEQSCPPPDAEFRFLTLNDFPDAPEVVEDAGTFAGNAAKKAVVLAKWLSHLINAGSLAPKLSDSMAGEVFVLADDSGLQVDALNGAPDVHSARFAALDTGHPGNSATAENNTKLLRLLQNVPAGRRGARFRCVIALVPVLPMRQEMASPACAANEFELQTELFEGACEGQIELAPRGKGGFGYDPLFVPQGFTQTFAELPEEIKNRLSHRADALRKLRKRLARNPADS